MSFYTVEDFHVGDHVRVQMGENVADGVVDGTTFDMFGMWMISVKIDGASIHVPVECLLEKRTAVTKEIMGIAEKVNDELKLVATPELAQEDYFRKSPYSNENGDGIDTQSYNEDAHKLAQWAAKYLMDNKNEQVLVPSS